MFLLSRGSGLMSLFKTCNDEMDEEHSKIQGITSDFEFAKTENDIKYIEGVDIVQDLNSGDLVKEPGRARTFVIDATLLESIYAEKHALKRLFENVLGERDNIILFKPCGTDVSMPFDFRLNMKMYRGIHTIFFEQPYLFPLGFLMKDDGNCVIIPLI